MVASTTVTFFFFFLLSLLSLLTRPTSAAHNITAILSDFPEYSLYNSYLTQTKISDEINSRETLTVLVLPNSVMSSLAAKRPLSAVKNALRLLTLLDYYDSAKLHSIARGTVLTTTLLQTTGSTTGNLGFLNITDLKGGKVGFTSAAPGSTFDSVYTKSVKQQPYSLSVLEISAPVIFPGLLDAPAKSTANITSLLDKAGCKTFAYLIVSTGVLKMYESVMDKALTVFAPNDEAFKSAEVPNLSGMKQVDLVTLLQYHALPDYSPKASLRNMKSPIKTFASNGAGKFDLSVVTRGDDVGLTTGLDTSRVASTVIDDTPLCILTVDKVLLPAELFGKAPAPAPSPSLSPSAAPAASSEAPTPAPVIANPPSPVLPPSHPSETPNVSPAGTPEKTPADSGNETSTGNGSKSPLLLMFLSPAIPFIITLLLSS